MSQWMSSRRNSLVKVGQGVRLEDIYSTHPKIYTLRMSHSERLRHWMSFGTTGCGKTRLIEHLIEQDIRSGKNLCMIDPKGDQELLAKIIKTARQTNRMDELIFISPVYPDISTKLNPFAHYYRPEEIVQHVIASIPAGKEPFFAEVAKEVTLTAVFSFYYLSQFETTRRHLTISDLRKKVSRSELEDTTKQLSYHRDDPKIAEIHSTISQIIQSPLDYFSKITSTLRTTLTQLSVGSIGEIVGNSSENEFIDRLEHGRRVIIVIQTGALMFRDPAFILARMITSMIQSLVGRFYASQRVFDPPLMLYIDEASNVFYNGIEDLFNKSRGAGVAIHALTQSVSDISSRLGEDRARVILDNCNTKLFFKVNDPATSAYVSALMGQRSIYSPTFTSEGDIRYTASDQAVLDEASAIKLKPRQFFFFTQHNAYRGRTVDVQATDLRVQWPGTTTRGNHEDNSK
ncbi:type IV secretory system conjugative DNA transfer family protein [Desulfoferrobacter suflitae]|uniref:type IV secretory system conjugative DNA transfer family protein n=1 Tax=Desulfoferrobacter suflitae TaxID=2865782 RepID=UPI002164718C|nr:TraM recognition domain-containing protein [Desulfoferrobacter suflitae]MCK8604383.1 type IV secretion system DNA-binding domain-containing protein [Desulfoferrobacter suflitae]